MRLDVSPNLNAARLDGTRAFLDTGAGNASIALYDAEFAAGATPPVAPLVTIKLSKPCGVITDVLTLTPLTGEGELIMRSGVPLTARFRNGNGEWAMDGDVSGEDGDGVVRLEDTNLLAGGRVPLLVSVIG